MNRTDLLFGSRESVLNELAGIARAIDINRIAELRAEIEKHPNYPDLRYRLANLLFQAGRYDDVLTELETAIAINPSFADALALKAKTLLALGRTDSAIDAFQSIVERARENADAHYHLAVLWRRREMEDRGLEHAKTAIASDPNHELAHAFLGEHYLFTSDWPSAIEHYEAANRLRPHEEYSYVLGLLHLQQGRAERGTYYLTETIRMKPNHFNAAVRLAVVHVAEGNLDQAYDVLNLAVGFHPKYPDLRYSLAKVCLLMGKRDEAYELMKSSLELNPRYAEVKREMGYLYSLRKMNREAVTEIEQSLVLNPDDEQAFINLGFIRSHQGEYESAVETLVGAINRFPDSWRLYHSLGIIHLQHKAYPKAKLSLSEAIKINPELEAIHRSLRIAFRDEALLDEERQRLLAEYSDPAEKPLLQHELGLIHLDFNKDEVAVTCFQESLAAGHDPVLNRMLLATTYANMQNFDHAVRTLAEIKAEGEVFQNRQLLMGLFQANGGDHQHSAQCYQQVMSEAPLYFYSLRGLPICFREQETLDDLLDDYLDYARFHQRTSRLFVKIGRIYAQKGMLVEAKQHFDHAIILDPNEVEAYHAIGILMLLRLSRQAALDYFRRAAEKRPDWAAPYLNTALVEHSLGNEPAAKTALRRYLQLEQKTTWREQAAHLLSMLPPTTFPIDVAAAPA